MSTRPLAVVTGASSGIGFELAQVFAENGWDLLITAEDRRVHEAAKSIEGRGADVLAVRADLANPSEVDDLAAAIGRAGHPVEALAINAGIGAGGRFVAETDLGRELRMIDINVRSSVQLAKLVLPAMAERGGGRVMFTSSVAATVPGTYQAVYDASKSFIQSFATALRAELAGAGVTVTVLMPGPTATAFWSRAGMDDTLLSSGPMDDPARVAEQAYAALVAGDERVVTANGAVRFQVLASRFLPDSVKAAVLGVLARPGSGRQQRPRLDSNQRPSD